MVRWSTGGWSSLVQSFPRPPASLFYLWFDQSPPTLLITSCSYSGSSCISDTLLSCLAVLGFYSFSITGLNRHAVCEVRTSSHPPPLPSSQATHDTFQPRWLRKYRSQRISMTTMQPTISKVVQQWPTYLLYNGFYLFYIIKSYPFGYHSLAVCAQW